MGKRAKNDLSLQQIGVIYQYLIALKDCFELKEDENLYIETHGDITVISSNKEKKFQKEVKHHLNEKNLSDRDIDFWKTLTNWYSDYDRYKDFKELILHTTSQISETSSFYNWDKLSNEEKLKKIKLIGEIEKEKEKIFRDEYKKIFNENFDKKWLLEILGKLSIKFYENKIDKISEDFSKYILHIQEGERDNYISYLLGILLKKVKNSPHKCEISKREFEEICQTATKAYYRTEKLDLPDVESPTDEIQKKYEDKKFVKAILEINYSEKIREAINDYWRASKVAREIFIDCSHIKKFEKYKDGLESKLKNQKEMLELEKINNNTSLEECIKNSKVLYLKVMSWNVEDFWIYKNQHFFQRGVIHDIIDQKEIDWKVGEF